MTPIEETGHTPGPWLLEIEDERGHTIRMGSAIENPSYFDAHHVIEYHHGVEIDDDNGQPNEQYAEAEANARLIAAAPDLMEALEDIAASSRIALGGTLRKKINAALAKAKAQGHQS